MGCVKARAGGQSSPCESQQPRIAMVVERMVFQKHSLAGTFLNLCGTNCADFLLKNQLITVAAILFSSI